MLQSQADVAESSSIQARWVQNHFERWHKDDNYRKSLSNIWWVEEQIMQYDKIALEDHSYIAAKEERTLEKSWVLKLNKGCVQGPLNQRPHFVEAKRQMKRLHDEHVKETSEGNPLSHPKQR